MDRYDVIVVGGGHAGCEASLAAARLGCKVLLLTLSIDTIATMPCNPAIGGPAAKSHLVREVDALGGEMGKIIDRSFLNIRLLNESRGPAVHALRAQADKRLYQLYMTKALEDQPMLDVKQGLVTELLVEDGKVCGVKANTGVIYESNTVVLCTGTFLTGVVVIGSIRYSGGRQGEIAADELSESLRCHGIKTERFQTATPPRVDRRTIDFDRMQEQPGSEKPLSFSFSTKGRIDKEQVPCWLTRTTGNTIDVIKKYLEVSPIMSGSVHGKGPRFCPSIDRKVLRFPNKESHQVFVEPEGVFTNEMYLLGLTTAMPAEVQELIVRTIPGLEEANIIRYGYAVEYDYISPGQLKLSLENKVIEGLFSAGQINGSSGYEEAAAQGIIAGVNAARKANRLSPVILDRAKAYTGVMIDDIVTKGVDEPYRMMTSKAEYRLSLRISNADLRLTPIGHEIGLIPEERYEDFIEKMKAVEEEIKMLKNTPCNPTKEVRETLESLESGDLAKPVNMAAILQRPEIGYDDIKPIYEQWKILDDEVKKEVEIQTKFSGYIEREMKQIDKFAAMEAKQIPEDIDYDQVSGLKNQGRERLKKIRPESIGQAGRIAGVSPADIAVLMVYIDKLRNQKKQAG